MKTLVHDFLAASARQNPDRVALIDESEQMTFGQVEGAADRVASRLQGRGIRRGDRVAIMMDNSCAAVVSLFGVLKAGGVFVMVNPTTKGPKLHYVLNDCAVSGLITQPSLLDVVASVRGDVPSLHTVIWRESPSGQTSDLDLQSILAEPHTAPRDPGLIDNDLCMIMYTSGSTGDGKGVMLTHRNMSNTAWAISTYLRNVPDDVVLCVLPLSFDYGLYQVITGARVGFQVVLERSFAYPYKTLQAMITHGVTGLPGVPTIFATLLQMDTFSRGSLSTLRYVSNTAAALPPAHIGRMRELFPTTQIFSMYGLTECTRVSYLEPELVEEKIASVGKAMPNEEVYIVDDQGRRLGPGQIGELVIRGANVMRGYWGKPEATARVLREGDIAGEKVLHSGDLFRMDDEGFLYFVGRVDDVFKCKGEKVSPREIENVLYELELVGEAAVIGVDDPIDGQAIKVFVAPRDGATFTAQQIRAHCRARLENHLVPKFIEIRSSLPKTPSGKIKKSALRSPAD